MSMELYEVDVERAASSILRNLSVLGTELTAFQLKRKAGVEVSYPAFCAALKMLVEAGFVVHVQLRDPAGQHVRKVVYRIGEQE